MHEDNYLSRLMKNFSLIQVKRELYLNRCLHFLLSPTYKGMMYGARGTQIPSARTRIQEAEGEPDP